MNDRFIESREALAYAREALKNGEKEEARRWALRAANLAPKSEDPWLILTSVSNPRESVEYARKALELNPDSSRAKKGMEWALARSGETPQGNVSSGNEKQAQGPVRNDGVKKTKAKSKILPILLIVMGCGVFMFAAWSAVTSPALASILSIASAPEAQTRQSFAQVNIAKPSAMQPIAQVIPPTAIFTAIPTDVVLQETQPDIVDILPTDPPTLEAVVLPSDTPLAEPAVVASVPEATSEPGIVSAEIVADTPTSEYIAPTAAPNAPPQVAVGNGEHWIDVDLSQQRVYAYAGDTVMNTFVVSTGTWQTPTVTGKYHIWIKLLSTTMTGPGYYLPNVPYTMYFYKGYGLHGTYWHNNFGTPMSHGCVNLRTDDAEWLYNFSVVGTLVNVHY
jgi:lipoprotein-anchoring transpeptidase ErfK/SrfK